MSGLGDKELVYFVSDELLRRFASSTPLQRLEWLEEARTFTWNAATIDTRARWRSERAHARGAATEPIDGVGVRVPR